MSILYCDYETRSACDLKVHGAYIYAQDPSTEVICMCYAFDDEEVETWVPGEPFPERVAEYFKSGGLIAAHNAQFDRLITWYVVCPEEDVQEPPIERWYCTAAQARSNCFPGALGSVGQFASAEFKKSFRGAQLIRWLSMPLPDGTFNRDPILLGEMADYCRDDVIAMRSISKAMRGLSAEELLDYQVNERVNDFGIFVDAPLCESAITYAEVEKQEIDALVKEITGGEITSVRSTKTCAWVRQRVGEKAVKLMETYKDDVKKYSMDKAVRANLLAMAEEDPEQIPLDVADVIQCVDDLSASSVAKFKKLVDLADPEDKRVRGSFIFAGGVATGRYASYGLQIHNLARSCAKDPTAVRASMIKGESLVPEYGPCVTAVLKGMLRPSFIPAPGKVFITADWSSIEGRINPWLSDSQAGEDKLDQYRAGLDPYIVNAAELYQIPYENVSKDQRQLGKIMELSLSFGGAAGSFAKFSQVYKISISDREIEKAIRIWRKKNPWMEVRGNALDTAARSAMRHKGIEFNSPRVTYLFDGIHLWYILPSGRILCYPYAKIEDDSITYAKASWKPAADAKEWPRGRLWYGEQLNATTQGTANDILRYALRELDDLYYDMPAHVHDEVLCEVDEDKADECLKDMTRIMTTPPEWAIGLPLEVDIKLMTRYGK